MKASKLLAQARPLIENGDTRYICLALSKVLEKKKKFTPSDFQVAERVRERIMALLHPYISLEDWLTRRGIKIWGPTGPEGARRLRQTRLNWIDDLVTYFKAKGD